mgnify:CR=1 FL=1
MLVVMKNLTSVQPLIVLRTSHSGLAVQVCTEQEAGMLALSNRHIGWIGIWLPLSQVVIKDRKVVAVSTWLVRKHKLARPPEGLVGAW